MRESWFTRFLGDQLAVAKEENERLRVELEHERELHRVAKEQIVRLVLDDEARRTQIFHLNEALARSETRRVSAEVCRM